ncbi:MAG: thiopurine S-methyltransferase [Polyangiaceae bacterium]|jgi:thiopurine S-methyltransferase|nr:thiopurine S-methyltransferase [Polyangiaceae bacterium]
MEAAFWEQRWREGKIGFHEAEGSALLRAHLEALTGGRPGSVLVPLCGKSVDLQTLAEAGQRVVGVELSPLAIEAFFAERGLSPERGSLGPFERSEGAGVSLLCGDFFALAAAQLDPFDAVFDRAALVALAPGQREAYVDLLHRALRPGGRVLLVTLSYDQALAPGPPFSVEDAEVHRLFAPRFELTLLGERAIEAQSARLVEQGVRTVREAAWLLSDRARR